MDRFFIDRGGKVEEYAGKKEKRNVGFPVCLYLKYGEDQTVTCYDFILNMSMSGIFIKTDANISPGSRVFMRFYIPPGEKILGEFSGEVVNVNRDGSYPRGVSLKFIDYEPGDLQKFEDFLEGKRHLFDDKA